MARRFGKFGAHQHRTEGGDRDGWQIIYTGFILIMLCFFIMLTSFASLDPSRITRFVNSFSQAVSVSSGGQSIAEGDALVDAEMNLIAKEDLCARLFDQVRQAASDQGLDAIDLSLAADGVVLRLKEKLLFESAEAALTSEACNRLDKIAGIIRRFDLPVEIQGHTDDRPIRSGRFPSNWELSTARAVAVLRYLGQSAGVDARLLSAVGYAEFKPLTDNDSETGRAVNRRVDFLFEVQEGQR